MEMVIVVGIVAVAFAGVGYGLYRSLTGKSGCPSCPGCGEPSGSSDCPTAVRGSHEADATDSGRSGG